MDRERVAATAETYKIRSRGLLRTAVQIVGIAAVLIGAYNYLIAPMAVTGPVFIGYRGAVSNFLATPNPIIADMIIIVAGAIVAWMA